MWILRGIFTFLLFCWLAVCLSGSIAGAFCRQAMPATASACFHQFGEVMFMGFIILFYVIRNKFF